MSRTGACIAAACLALVSACAGAPHAARHAAVSTPTTSSSAAAAAAAATATATPTAAGRPYLLVDHVRGIGSARQVVIVTAPGYRTSHATVSAFARTASGWGQVFGPWPARIGYHGFAPPQRKREGDGRTPTGVYGFQFMFGAARNPGVHFAYRRALRTSRWDDDPKSVHYNQWVDSRTADAGRSPERMRQVPAYRYGAVIGYNTARTPGSGSAIFLHVAHTGATSGCVSLPEPQLLAVLRWLTPKRSPRIVMGTLSAVVH